jgi:hypothetical protein
MCAVTLAVDAIKNLKPDSKRDHLTETVELNEFVCNMHPSFRPKNRSLLFHVVSDLLGLLMYGIPRKRRHSIENLETIDYSSRSVAYPVARVWSYLKERIKSARSTDEIIVKGFISKIRIEADIICRYPLVEEAFRASRSCVREWIPPLSDFYDISGEQVVQTFTDWSDAWLDSGGAESVVDGMIDRLSAQLLTDFSVAIDKNVIKKSILGDPEGNRNHNENFSNWYKEGVVMLFKI